MRVYLRARHGGTGSVCFSDCCLSFSSTTVGDSPLFIWTLAQTFDLSKWGLIPAKATVGASSTFSATLPPSARRRIASSDIF